ncbi:MAG: hypothetical protein K8R60_14805 [Burkholderiales bacterium]|nr:hypothetical protein [Burkholderiales bacterium]
MLAAAAVVFGTPFVYFFQASLRGSFSSGTPAFLAMGTPLSTFLLWATTLALGSIWLGSSLALGGSSGRIRRGMATGLILAGMMMLVIAARFAGSSVFL